MTAALTIAFVPGVSPAKWARVWRDRFPTIELRLRAIGADEVVETLAGEPDMAFARAPFPDGHNAIPLWTETAVVAVPKDSPLADLAEIDLSETDVHVVDAGPVPADVDAALDLVEANVGVVVLPQSLFRAASRKDLLARPLVGSPGTRIALVWRDEDASETTEEFIGVVRGRTANSSRGAQDEPGGTDRTADAGTRPSGGGKATAANKKTVAKRGATKGTGAKSGGGKNSTGRGRVQRGMKGKPKRGSKGNR
ncbi:LysR family transcriptional regulator substrate-binding protein [Curtobacterium sp. SP.BCo]|uniref:LysR family transcriptional regulator substrate-binding protein n=1 Tax=Curtobacterium sp. SP.BCo TaxID=3435229 RepID=UPI003F73C71D